MARGNPGRVRRAAGAVDDRFAAATPLRRLMNYLAFFFDPSMAEVTYDGPYTPLRGIEMSRAYESSLEIAFDVRGGLFIRQMHH